MLQQREKWLYMELILSLLQYFEIVSDTKLSHDILPGNWLRSLVNGNGIGILSWHPDPIPSQLGNNYKKLSFFPTIGTALLK